MGKSEKTHPLRLEFLGELLDFRLDGVKVDLLE